MDIVIKHSQGQNIVVRPQARPVWYPPATIDPVSVDVYWRTINDDGSRGAWQFLGSFAPGARWSFPYNPDIDRHVEVSSISKSATGVGSVSNPDHGVRATVLVQRDTQAPAIGQVGAAGAEQLTVGVTGFSRFARKRMLRIADNAAMTDASVIVFDSASYIEKELPRYVDIARSAVIVPDFTWAGDDPVGHGFTKTGTGTTAQSSSPAGWKITTTGVDAKTFYSKSSFPPSPFTEGFTLEVVPPHVNQTDNAGPAACVAARVEDGSRSFELQFDLDEVRLNGGALHPHAGTKVRLVVSAGGATADLWIGETKVEDNTAGGASSTTGLTFGDLADADDSEAVWSKLEYALTPQDPALAATIYVRVSHSSGAGFGPESAVTAFTFAGESGTGGSNGDFDPRPRDNYKLDQNL